MKTPQPEWMIQHTITSEQRVIGRSSAFARYRSRICRRSSGPLACRLPASDRQPTCPFTDPARYRPWWLFIRVRPTWWPRWERGQRACARR